MLFLKIHQKNSKFLVNQTKYIPGLTVTNTISHDEVPSFIPLQVQLVLHKRGQRAEKWVHRGC